MSNHSDYKKNYKKIVVAAFYMALGLFLLKYLPMNIWGSDILFDASIHITIASAILYILWFFIDQNRGWRTPFFIFAGLVLSVISLQRIESNAHNDVGLLLGILISLISIGVAERHSLKGKFKF